MALARSKSVRQLKEIQKLCDKKGGDIGSKSDGDLKTANVHYVHEVPKKTKVDTYEDFTNPKGEGRKTQKNMQNLHIYKENNQYNMKNLINFNEHCNTLDLLRLGKQIEFGNVKGFINKIEGTNIWIEVTGHGEVETKLEKFSIVDIAKKFKVE